MNPPRVSVVIPTRRRPQSLERAIRSVAAQEPGCDIELIVVDNDAQGQSRELAMRLAAELAIPVVYVREPVAGVASARNAGLAKVAAPFIAFLDDDEEAPPGWLSELLAAQIRFDADVVFGAVRGRAPPSLQAHRAYLEYFFSRTGPADPGVIEQPFGCGNSLVRTAALPSSQPFAVTQNHIGGEDDLLFGAMKARGARFAWSPQAWVWEDPLPERLTLAYALRRRFSYGQGPAYAAWRRGLAGIPTVAFWMGVGAVQAVGSMATVVARWILRRPDLDFALHRLAGDLGKVIWFPPFKLKFYGLPLDGESRIPGRRASGPIVPAHEVDA